MTTRTLRSRANVIARSASSLLKMLIEYLFECEGKSNCELCTTVEMDRLTEEDDLGGKCRAEAGLWRTS